MLHEYGGNIENASERDLYIYPVVSPAWTKPGEHLAMVNAPSEFGLITSRMDFTKDGATLTYSPLYNESQPRSVLQIQWNEVERAHKGTFAELLKAYRSCDSFVGPDKKGYPEMIPGKAFLLSDEDASMVEPLNFDLVKKAFIKEFDRRTSNKK